MIIVEVNKLGVMAYTSNWTNNSILQGHPIKFCNGRIDIKNCIDFLMEIFYRNNNDKLLKDIWDQ